jgi:hypothetical protein
MPLSGTLTKARTVEANVQNNGHTQPKAFESVETKSVESSWA